MADTEEQASVVAGIIADTVKFEHLRSKRFDRQTDAVQLSFAVAQMEAQRGCAVMLVDGLIKTSLQTEALNYKKGPQAYFSQRCHDKGLKCRRIIILDAKSTKTMSSKSTGEGILHFHGIFLLEGNMNERWLRQRLTAVFGNAGIARRNQFKVGQPDNAKSHSYAGQTCSGITGKLAYMLHHVGATCSRLKLNEDGKRSRRAPTTRRKANVNAEGLAKGIPSNFVGKVLIWDTQTRKQAKAAFNIWYANRSGISGSKQEMPLETKPAISAYPKRSL